MLPRSGWALSPPITPKARVIVIGGGMGGATVAKYLRLWGDDVAVTLVERNARYVSNILSSLVLTGQRTIPNLTFGYDTLRNRYGVEVIIDDVAEVDPVRVAVKLTSGKKLSADRIVMAPGIDFESVPGLDDTRMPHAWKAGDQTDLLAKQLGRMPENGIVVLTVPKAPYRCPPGPYERACLIADWLKTTKPRAKLILLDANPDIAVEKDIFGRAFSGPYAQVIEYRSGVEVTSADSRADAVIDECGSGSWRRHQRDPAASCRGSRGSFWTHNRQQRALRSCGCAELRQQGRAERACDWRFLRDHSAQSRPHCQPGGKSLC